MTRRSSGVARAAALAAIASAAACAYAEAPQMSERFVIVSGGVETDKALGEGGDVEALLERWGTRAERSGARGDWLIDLGERAPAESANILRDRLNRALVAPTDDPNALLAPVDESALSSTEQAELGAFREALGRDTLVVAARAPPARYGEELLTSPPAAESQFSVVDPTGGSRLFSTQRLTGRTRFQAIEESGGARYELSVLADGPKPGERMAVDGFLYGDDGTYRITPLNDLGLHAVYRLEDTDGRSDHGVGFLGRGYATFDEQCRSEDTVLRIGWVTEDGAHRWLRADRRIIPGALRRLGDTFKRHRIAGYTLVLEPALAQPFFHNARRADDMARDLGSYPDSFRFVDWYSALETMEADLAVVFVAFPAGASGDACGATWEGGRRRLFVVDLHCMTDKRRAFEHELGHIFGAEHDELCYGVRNREPDYRYDWRATSQTFGTIVAEWECQGVLPLTERYDHYSDPRIVDAQGVPHGDPATHNVAQLIAERIQAVAGYSSCR